jgi:hypothetical protein
MGPEKLVRGTLVTRHRVLVISSIFVTLASKASAAAVPVTGAAASQCDLPIYLTGPSADQASFAEGGQVVVNRKLRQNAKGAVTLPTPAVAKQARAS